MYAEINGPRGLSIATAEPTCEVVIAPFQLKTFGIGNYDLLCLNFNVNDINYGSLTQEQKVSLDSAWYLARRKLQLLFDSKGC